MEYVTITDRQGNLFGYPTLTLTIGRDFFITRERHFTYASEAEMQRALRGMIDRRLRKGFEVLYSFFRERRYESIEHLLRRRGAPTTDTLVHPRDGSSPGRCELDTG